VQDGLEDLQWIDFVFSNGETDVDSTLKFAYKLVKFDLTEPNINHLTKCSAMIKLTPDFSDLMVAHATWQG